MIEINSSLDPGDCEAIMTTSGKLRTILVIEQLGDRCLLLLDEQTPSLLNSLELLGLSPRETEVLFWIMQGKDNKAIAAQLSVGKSTVRKHLESIYCKLGVQSRTEAIAQTLEKLGFIKCFATDLMVKV